MGRKIISRLLALLMCSVLMTGCAGTQKTDDYATNKGYDTGSSGDAESSSSSSGISKDKIKVGVIHLSDPAEGSGYTYTHDLGIQGMQQNLGLSDSQIIRKNNVSDSDEEATEKAIQECVDEGCNIIFTTSWGYMKATAKMAEKYPQYQFEKHKGYGTKLHYEMLDEYGVSDIHRKTFLKSWYAKHE